MVDVVQNRQWIDSSKVSKRKEKVFRTTYISSARNLKNLEDFDYNILETSSVEALLKDIIKRQKKTYNKINFLAHHFAQGLEYLPSRLFIDDDENTE